MLETFQVRVQNEEAGKCKHRKNSVMWGNKTPFGSKKQSELRLSAWCPPGLEISTVVPEKLRCWIPGLGKEKGLTGCALQVGFGSLRWLISRVRGDVLIY